VEEASSRRKESNRGTVEASSRRKEIMEGGAEEAVSVWWRRGRWGKKEEAWHLPLV
jgi:hypothetical protein